MLLIDNKGKAGVKELYIPQCGGTRLLYSKPYLLSGLWCSGINIGHQDESMRFQ